MHLWNSHLLTINGDGFFFLSGRLQDFWIQPEVKKEEKRGRGGGGREEDPTIFNSPYNPVCRRHEALEETVPTVFGAENGARDVKNPTPSHQPLFFLSCCTCELLLMRQPLRWQLLLFSLQTTRPELTPIRFSSLPRLSGLL